jgi:hypothetical protein
LGRPNLYGSAAFTDLSSAFLWIRDAIFTFISLYFVWAKRKDKPLPRYSARAAAPLLRRWQKLTGPSNSIVSRFIRLSRRAQGALKPDRKRQPDCPLARRRQKLMISILGQIWPSGTLEAYRSHEGSIRTWRSTLDTLSVSVRYRSVGVC